MIKEKWKQLCGFLVKHSKLILPVVLILVVAMTVSLALKANDVRAQGESIVSEDSGETSAESTEMAVSDVVEEVPLEENTIPEIRTLMCTYYNAYATGDVETIKSISNYLEETDEIRIQAMSEYVESYPEIQVYTKPGPIENSYLAYVYFQMTVKNFEDQISGMETFYVCTKEDGTLYLNEGEVSDEELEYIRVINSQDDVVELYNCVTVECNDTFLNNADLFYYIQEIVNDVQKSTGETLAAQMGSTEEKVEDSEEGEAASSEAETSAETETTVETESAGPVYAKATTTVNVRVSDSEKADKAGKVSGGTKVEIVEQQVNGWSKIKADGIEGYIKSEYLSLLNTVNASDAIGTVTATSNVNVRALASETADRLGVLAGGETVDLLGKENGWCKINYDGQVGYVKEEFVQ